MLAWFWDSNSYYRTLFYLAVFAVIGYYIYKLLSAQGVLPE